MDLSDWRQKIEVEMAGEEDVGDAARITLDEADGSFHKHSQYKDGMLTIGCCGK